MVFIKEKVELIKEKAELVKDRAALLKGKLQEVIPYIAYFPFIGWFFPMYFRKDDRFLLFHSLQGFVLAAFFFLVSTLLYFITAFVPAEGGTFKFVIVMLIYAGYLIYLVFAVMGTVFMLKKFEKGLPFFKKIASRIEI